MNQIIYATKHTLKKVNLREDKTFFLDLRKQLSREESFYFLNRKITSFAPTPSVYVSSKYYTSPDSAIS